MQCRLSPGQALELGVAGSPRGDIIGGVVGTADILTLQPRRRVRPQRIMGARTAARGADALTAPIYRWGGTRTWEPGEVHSGAWGRHTRHTRRAQNGPLPHRGRGVAQRSSVARALARTFIWKKEKGTERGCKRANKNTSYYTGRVAERAPASILGRRRSGLNSGNVLSGAGTTAVVPPLYTVPV